MLLVPYWHTLHPEACVLESLSLGVASHLCSGTMQGASSSRLSHSQASFTGQRTFLDFCWENFCTFLGLLTFVWLFRWFLRLCWRLLRLFYSSHDFFEDSTPWTSMAFWSTKKVITRPRSVGFSLWVRRRCDTTNYNVTLANSINKRKPARKESTNNHSQI
mgnify:CR=1 FL=1